MDPTEMDNIVNNLNEDSDSEEDQAEEEMEEDDEDVEEAEQDVDEEEEEDKMVEDEEKEEEEEEEAPVSSKQQSTSKKFRDLYMTKVTQAFGSDLDQIRQVKNVNLFYESFVLKQSFYRNLILMVLA